MGSSASITIGQNDTLIIREHILRDTCLNSPCDNNFIFSYHCNNWLVDSSIFCSNCIKVDTSQYRITSCDVPKLNLVNLHNSNLYNQEFSCFNRNKVQWQYRLTHDSTSVGSIAKLLINLHNGFQDITGPLLPTRLSLMPLSDIALDCRGCTIDSVRTRINTNSFCQDSVNDNAEFYYAYLYDFDKLDTVFINFTTYRCAAEVDTALINSDKILNDRLLGYEIYSPCDFVTRPPLLGLDVNVEGVVQFRDLSYRYNFIPLINNLQVDTNGVGDSTAMEMLMFKSPYNNGVYQYLGVDGTITNIDSMNPQGWLRMQLNCVQGIKPAHDSTYIVRVISDTSSMVIYPSFYYSNAYDSCANNQSNYYFALTPNILHALIDGKIKTILYACCDIKPGSQKASMSLHILPNPDSCFTLLPTDTITPPILSDTLQAYIPLVGVEQAYHVHCPGCKAPGIIVDDYKLRRTNLGLRDSDNNGVADSGAFSITKGDSYYNANKNLLQLHNSAFGDKLVETQIARFNDGVPSKGGYSYQQMLDLNAPLDYLNFATSIPEALETMILKVEGFDFYIDSIDTTAIGACTDCGLMEADSVYFRTILKLSADTNILHSFLQTDTTQNLFFYTFSTDANKDSNLLSGHNYITTNNFDGFYPNQRYRLHVRYEVCGTFAAPDNPGSLEDVSIKADITAGSWLTGTQMTMNAPSIHGQMPNDTIELHDTLFTILYADTPAYTIIDTNFTNQFLFYCEWNGSLHYFFAQQNYFDRIPTQSQTSCGYNLKIIDNPTLAGNYLDPYPYEFHPPAFRLRDIKFLNFPGYVPDSVAAVRELIVGNSTHTTDTLMLGVTPVGNMWLIDNNVPTNHCLTEDSIPYTDSTIWFVNELSYRTYYYIHYQPDSCQRWLNIDDGLLCQAQALVDSLPCMALANCENTFALTRTHNFNDSTQSNLSCAIDNAANDVVTGTKCWPITFNNQYKIDILYSDTTGNQQISSGAAPFVYLYPMDTTHFTGFYWVSGTDTVWPVQGVLQINRALGFAINTTASGTLCANYTTCYDTAGLHSTPIAWGYDCYGWPTANTVATSCGYHIDTLFSYVYDGDLNAEYTDSLYYGKCTPFTQSVAFSTASNACLHVDSVTLNNIPQGFNITNVVAYTATDTVLLQGNATSFMIGDSIMHLLGYADSLLCDTTLNISLTYELACAPAPTNNRIRVTLHTHTPCGDYVFEESGGGYFFYNGTNNCTDCFTITKMASTANINAYDTITYTITVTSNNGSTQLVVVSDSLPPNFTVLLPNHLPDTLIMAAQDSVTYTVQGYFTQTGNCPYTYNFASITNGNVILNDSVCVEVNPMYMTDTTFTIENQSVSSSLPSNYFINSSLYINGTLIIDNSATFDNCNIYVSAGGQIIIDVGNSLNISNTTIQACDSM
ncbi:MAG: DUF11 domain-containing protein [Bacteroidetes bacterium]|nr:DUF11 domain-containing protein [Bacteroidota bacterium]